ncbi:DUF3000 domain-containing protein [Corynebacterium sp. 045007]|uniref:DUF3000 domain-containing protein n=1 Tax=Corynebacterium sp. 045007 TaxID=3156078 RepID=UPI00345BEC20
MAKFRCVNGTDSMPQNFRAAVQSMHSAELRPEIALGTVRPPQKLAPFSHAVSLEVTQPEADIVPESSDDDAFGRLILLHDPRSEETWDGDMRLVAYIQADMDASLAEDPLLPQVAWQWLTEALAENNAELSNLGGTVTTTNSVRYGEIGGKPQAFQLEMRASWTARGTDLRTHVESFAQVLANVAGLPPVGVSLLG